VIEFVVTFVLLSLSPEFRFAHDRRECDGERYVELCAGLYQRPETWACVEVAR
jgi:hypothetical protein